MSKKGDRTSHGENDDDDPHVTDRDWCAQLLSIFVARETDLYKFPSVGANDLDGFYHEYTLFDTVGETAKRFERALECATWVLRTARHRADKTKKFPKLDAFSIVFYFQDWFRDGTVATPPEEVFEELASRILEERDAPKIPGKTTSGDRIRKHYIWWRENVALGIGFELDPQRLFDDRQRVEIRNRQSEKCAACRGHAREEDAQYDHFPRPYWQGGRTVVENGRMVHSWCHPRGRITELT